MTKLFLFFPIYLFSQYVLIPMDYSQTDHLKAYGITYQAIVKKIKSEWILNYRGGSFVFEKNDFVQSECKIKGVLFETLSAKEYLDIRELVEQQNMEIIQLEKAPKIAVYTPKNKLPWDDAVTMVLTYAGVEYDKIYDQEILSDKLQNYDWLHLHHEDFTGQYGKFYNSFKSAQWYIEQQLEAEKLAHELGFNKVSKEKGAVAKSIKQYIDNGGFLFAMCSATDALDIALATDATDIADTPFDYDGIDPNYAKKIDYSKTFAFTDFDLITNPYIYEYSNIDVPPSNNPRLRDAERDYFTLFEFSAKYDPIPTMLTQNHSNAIRGFMGQTTMYDKAKIKTNVTILGEIENTNEVKYIYGQSGKGFFCFLWWPRS